MVNAIEHQRPIWPIGTQGAYHSMTWGYLLGELIQRVDERDFRTFFMEEVIMPLNADYQFGLPDEDLSRVVDVIPNVNSATLNAMKIPDSNIGRAWRVMPPKPDFFNTLEFRKAVFASGNGHGNAAAMARIYAVLAEGGELDGVRLFSRDVIEKARTVQWESACGLTDRPFKYGLGFFLNKPPMTPLGANPRNFGHPGAGGAVGIADTEARMSFSYSPNYMCSGEGLGRRCEALIHAALG
jgi:CubicO group peptidase (beta-lactamase class C family)